MYHGSLYVVCVDSFGCFNEWHEIKQCWNLVNPFRLYNIVPTCIMTVYMKYVSCFLCFYEWRVHETMSKCIKLKMNWKKWMYLSYLIALTVGACTVQVYWNWYNKSIKLLDVRTMCISIQLIHMYMMHC